MRIKFLPFLNLAFIVSFLLYSCDTKVEKGPGDTPRSGTIHISVDESFAPVIDQQVAQYKRLYPGANIIVDYKPEASAFKDLFYDTATRMVIVTKPLTKKEERFLSDSLGYRATFSKIASDAIALIVNIKNNDSLFTIKRLQDQLLGKINKNQKIVFDGLSATSAVRYITDSILKGQAFDTSVVKAAKNSEEVINYIASDENAIGIVGISWVGNPEDPAQVKMLEKIKIAYVQCDDCEGKPFVKPMQESIATRRYPLVRSLYYVLKENFSGLGTGFSSFLKYEQGQLIFRRSYLRPVMNFDVRNVKVNESLPAD